jgi:hypothetical protein
VTEVKFQSAAKVVKSGLPFKGPYEPVFRTFSVTGKQVFASVTVIGKRRRLGNTEYRLDVEFTISISLLFIMFPSKCSGYTKWSHE